MSVSPNNQDHDKMQKAVRLRDQRRKQWKKEGERSLWQNLSMVGALGWLIVTPTLLGVLIGRWLDGLFESGIFFSGTFVFLGISLGCYLAWQRVSKE
jgi:ATP synthase protein I